MLLVLALLFAACSSLVDERVDVCLGSPKECEETRFVRAWWARHVFGYDDAQPLRVEWARELPRGAAGYTYDPHTVEVISARALCHEIVHVQLWRATGDPCASHGAECLWASAAWAVEDDCKAALAEVP